jgi:hypothetical protein
MMKERVYSGDGIELRVRGLGGRHRVRIHLEHSSGAALIVPGCEERIGDHGPRLVTAGFDGTTFTIDFDDGASLAVITSSQTTPILGGGVSATIARGDDVELDPKALRVTGDEETMPIPVK